MPEQYANKITWRETKHTTCTNFRYYYIAPALLTKHGLDKLTELFKRLCQMHPPEKILPISLMFILTNPINSKSVLVQVMALNRGQVITWTNVDGFQWLHMSPHDINELIKTPLRFTVPVVKSVYAMHVIRWSHDCTRLGTASCSGTRKEKLLRLLP